MRKLERAVCPKCEQGRLAPVMYGYPDFTDELERMLAAGELVLGGCMPGPERWGCPRCRARYVELPGPDSRWGDIVWGIPVEIQATRGCGPERALVTVRRNDPWTLTFQFDDGLWQRPTIVALGDDLFGAFQGLCRAAAKRGVKLLVNGARRDVHRCQVDAPDTHHLVSLLRPGRPAALSDTANLLDPAPEDGLGTPDEQNDHLARWFRSLPNA
ncbi:hypothetical protein SAMN04489712_106106 [Thermomonospora echinospora]|uniref:Uncharacterized protein n=1 Tax=Thermomonospora echinospora TaxID=1992 RepID=A0A1H6AYD2_9ACTN|nr:hypothetical protein [Thermomonospora echinospora]SEG53643.1 hypothetical protein SAMN04489712_106106 [Thermomonospora echinospora]